MAPEHWHIRGYFGARSRDDHYLTEGDVPLRLQPRQARSRLLDLGKPGVGLGPGGEEPPGRLGRELALPGALVEGGELRVGAGAEHPAIPGSGRGHAVEGG